MNPFNTLFKAPSKICLSRSTMNMCAFGRLRRAGGKWFLHDFHVSESLNIVNLSLNTLYCQHIQNKRLAVMHGFVDIKRKKKCGCFPIVVDVVFESHVSRINTHPPPQFFTLSVCFILSVVQLRKHNPHRKPFKLYKSPLVVEKYLQMKLVCVN